MTNWSNFDYENEDTNNMSEQEKFYKHLNTIFLTIRNIIIISSIFTIILFIIMLISFLL